MAAGHTAQSVPIAATRRRAKPSPTARATLGRASSVRAPLTRGHRNHPRCTRTGTGASSAARPGPRSGPTPPGAGPRGGRAVRCPPSPRLRAGTAARRPARAPERFSPEGGGSISGPFVTQRSPRPGSFPPRADLTPMATHDERYGPDHRRRRRALAPAVEAGLTNCARCGEPILPGERWDLGHIDDGGARDYSGPEHARCNRATITHAKQAAEIRTSRDW